MGKYSVTVEAVREAVENLRKRKLHPNLAGYLCIKRDLRAFPSENSVKARFKAFFDEFLAVPDGPGPYLVPFKETASLESSPWFNNNVAGSYAPSSLRDGGAFLKVCSVDRNTKSFSLREDHANLALNHLASSQKIPSLSLATFLLRDFMFSASSFPDAKQLLTVFRDEFGYRESIDQEAHEFSVLFAEDQLSSDPLFEEVSG